MLMWMRERFVLRREANNGELEINGKNGRNGEPMTTYPGSCHCGAIQIRFESAKTPEEMRPGRCSCTFCRRHGARTMGDPDGSVEFNAAPGSVSRYRFGLGITDYLVCSKCGGRNSETFNPIWARPDARVGGFGHYPDFSKP